MCAHTAKSAWVNITFDSSWINTNLVFFEPSNGTIKITMSWFCRIKKKKTKQNASRTHKTKAKLR